MSGAIIIPFPQRGPERWVNKETVARHLTCCKRTVENRMRDEALPFVVPPGSNQPRFLLSEVNAWVRARQARLDGEATS